MKKYQLIAWIVFVMGCSANPPLKPAPEFVPIRPIVSSPAPQGNGSIYQAGYGVDLFSDTSAKRVGDIINIILRENTKAQKSASTSTSKDSNVEAAAPIIFGGGVSAFGQNVLSTSLAGSNDFSGQGNSRQSNSLSGSISVTVSEVLANGNLVVQGEKRLTLNQGSEHIRFSGIVRLADIGSDNTVLSSNVANSQIIYSGSGPIASANEQGWLTRFFNSSWWPF